MLTTLALVVQAVSDYGVRCPEAIKFRREMLFEIWPSVGRVGNLVGWNAVGYEYISSTWLRPSPTLPTTPDP